MFETQPSVPRELIALDNAVLLPHVGSASVKTRQAMAERVVSNLFAWAEGKPPVSSVAETPVAGQWGKRGVESKFNSVRPVSTRSERS